MVSILGRVFQSLFSIDVIVPLTAIGIYATNKWQLLSKLPRETHSLTLMTGAVKRKAYQSRLSEIGDGHMGPEGHSDAVVGDIFSKVDLLEQVSKTVDIPALHVLERISFLRSAVVGLSDRRVGQDPRFSRVVVHKVVF